ncbi:hypothetical protein HKD37_16G046178 [Glycine soja]
MVFGVTPLSIDISHSITLHMMILHSTSLLVRTLRPMVVPTNQHGTFQYVLSSLTHFLGNFPKDYSFHNCSNLIPTQPLEPSHSDVIYTGPPQFSQTASRINGCPYKQYKTFQCVLFLLTHFLGSFPKCQSSYNCSKLRTFNYEILK